MKTCTYRFYVKCNFSEVGVGQILKMETQDFRDVVKHCVKSWWVRKTYMKSWVAYGGRTALNTQQLKLGLGSSDAPGPTLIENRGQVAKKCYHPQKHRRCVAVYDMVMSARRVTLVQIVDTLGLGYGTVNTSLQIELNVIKCVAWWVPRMLTTVKRQMPI